MKEKRRKLPKAAPPSDSDTDDGAETSSNDETKKGSGNSTLTICERARILWLQNATKREDLNTVEDLYRRALNAKKEVLTKATKSKDHQSHKRKRNLVRKTVAALSPEEYRKAGERLSLLYLQSGRPYKATVGLKYLGFECRLSERVLNYPASFPSQPKKHNKQKQKQKRKKNQRDNTNHHDSALQQPPCCVVDDFLSPIELRHLRKVFGDIHSSYWTYHNYIIDKEPPAPYFSYVIDLREHRSSKSQKTKTPFLRRIIDKILRSTEVAEQFPILRRDARYVEMWAHNRPHASGHQLHFDSDDEGRSRQQGFPNHPICSFVLNVSSHARVGGPTLVTNQRLRNPETTNLQSVRGWLVPSWPSRMVCFDGSVLHGVIPGKGCIPEPQEDELGKLSTPRRVTLMMAFWKDIKVRKGSGPGSARPWPSPEEYPDKLPVWVKELNRSDVYSEGSSSPIVNATTTHINRLEHAQIVPVHRVYELLDGSPVPKYYNDENSGGEVYYMPEYDKVFQGF